jgi:APA family basic amino acid/polyamine antiporter
VLFIFFCFVVDLLILLHDPLPALVGVGIVACGLPARRIIQSYAPGSALSVVSE